MDFLIPAGSATNLPKEIVDEIAKLATEKAVLLKLLDNRNRVIEVLNEGTIPAIGAFDLDKFFRTEGTDDITTLTEASFSIQHPDLKPQEIGAYTYLKKKQIDQYKQLNLEKLFKNGLADGIGRAVEKLILVGQYSDTPGTDYLKIADGIVTIAEDSTKCALSPITYTESKSQAVADAVMDALVDLGAYADDEEISNLLLICSPDFYAAAQKSADRDIVGFELDVVPELGKGKRPLIHGIPLLKRSAITGEKAILVNLKSLFVGYYGKIEVEAQYKVERSAYLYVIKFWVDFKVGTINSDGKAEGLIEIKKYS